jgi:hypothetical protein
VESQWPEELLEISEIPEDRENIQAEPEAVSINIPPPVQPVIEAPRGGRMVMISAQALSGRKPGSAEAEEHHGGPLDPDTKQLVLTAPERKMPVALTVSAVVLAFFLGAVFEMIRFKRLLRGAKP